MVRGAPVMVRSVAAVLRGAQERARASGRRRTRLEPRRAPHHDVIQGASRAGSHRRARRWEPVSGEPRRMVEGSKTYRNFEAAQRNSRSFAQSRTRGWIRFDEAGANKRI